MSEDVRKMVEEFIPPTGYELLPRPKNASSLVWYAGARVKNTDENVVVVVYSHLAHCAHLRQPPFPLEVS